MRTGKTQSNMLTRENDQRLPQNRSIKKQNQAQHLAGGPGTTCISQKYGIKGDNWGIVLSPFLTLSNKILFRGTETGHENKCLCCCITKADICIQWMTLSSRCSTADAHKGLNMHRLCAGARERYCSIPLAIKGLYELLALSLRLSPLAQNDTYFSWPLRTGSKLLFLASKKQQQESLLGWRFLTGEDGQKDKIAPPEQHRQFRNSSDKCSFKKSLHKTCTK